MKRTVIAAAGMAALLVALLVPGSVAARQPERYDQINVNRRHPGLRDVLRLQRRNRVVEVAVQVQGPPVAVAQGAAIARGGELSATREASVRRTVRTRQRVVANRIESLGGRIQARYTDVFNGFRVRIRANQLRRLSRQPGVKDVLLVPRHTRSNATTVPFIGADRTWGQTDLTGRGVRIAIIDTGLNYYHLDFAGRGSDAWRADDPTRRERGTFPTGKVVEGHDFAGDDYDADDVLIPDPDRDPLDCKARGAETVQHGTHVAGTAAGTGVTAAGRTYTGPYNANTLSRTDFRIGPGIAPQAKLLAYRVFGCSGGSFLVVDAIERAVQDGADIINLSLGSAFGTTGTLDAVAADNASLAGATVVAASGNEGPSAYMTGTPGAAQRAISVAALDALEGFPTARFDMARGGDIRGINANDGDLPATGRLNVFRDDPNTQADSTGEGDEALGCFPQDYAFNDFVDGQIPVVRRGVCARTDRATQGQRQGAAAVVMINDSDSLPPFENAIAGVRIPFLGVRSGSADRFAANDGRAVTIRSGGDVSNPGFEHSADFSSAGPRRDDAGVKPEVIAPGVSVFSADGATGGQGKSLSGTSMATPVVAGIAALVKQAHPGWTPRDIKAAIVGTTAAGKVSPYDLRFSGAGVVQPRRAVDTVAFVQTAPGSSSLAFGYDEAGDSSGSSTSFSETRRMTIRNTSSRTIQYDLRNVFDGNSRGIRLSISPSAVTVPANGRRNVSVRVTLAESRVAALPAAAPNHAPKLAEDAFGQTYTPITTVGGAIVATPRTDGRGIYPLRVPWQIVPRGTSAIREVDGSRASWKVDGPRRTSSVRFRNFGLHKGIVDVYAWGLTDGRDGLGEIDLRAGGVQSLPTEVCTGEPDASDRCLVFAVNTWQRWSNAAANLYVVSVDVNGDDEVDYEVLGVDDGLIFLDEFNGLVDSLVLDAAGNLIDGFNATMAPNGTTLLLPALASDFGLSRDGVSAFEYSMESQTIAAESLQFDEMQTGDAGAGTRPRAQFDPFRPPLSSGHFASLASHRATRIPLTVHVNRYRPNRGHKGWLVVSLDDPSGAQQADIVRIGELP